MRLSATNVRDHELQFRASALDAMFRSVLQRPGALLRIDVHGHGIACGVCGFRLSVYWSIDVHLSSCACGVGRPVVTFNRESSLVCIT